MVAEVLVPDLVQPVRRDTCLDVFGDRCHRTSREPARCSHPLDGLGILDLRTARACGRGPPDVLGPGYVRGHDAGRGDLPGYDRGHDLEV